jgi:hypothetical protein
MDTGRSPYFSTDEIDPGIEHLPDIAEARIAQRHIAKPQRGETQFLGTAGEVFLVAHRRLVALESLDRKEDAQRKPVGREHAPETLHVARLGVCVHAQHAVGGHLFFLCT